MEEWKEYKLGEIGTIVGGATPSTKEPQNYDGNISWITPKDLSNYSGRYISRGERMITSEGYNSCSCKMLPKGSILFSSRAPIGYVAIAANELCTNQGFKSIIPDERLVDGTFLYYLLIKNKAMIEGLGSGTTFKEVSGNVMKNVVVKIPSLEIQRRIANVLSSLDDKIEVNRRINDNLEQQAQALFKSWFVDFEPFKDQPFVESELGMIPQGWKVISLDDACSKITDGSHYSPKDDPFGKIPMLSVKDMRHNGFDYSSCKNINEEEYEKMKRNDCVPLNKDILVAKDGSYLKEIFLCMQEEKQAILSSIAIFRSNSNIIYPELLLQLLRLPSVRKDVGDNYVSGSALPRIVLKDFKKFRFVIAPIEVQSQIIDAIRSINSQIYIKDLETRRLAELRDTLLPRLMSGELKVTDVD